MDIVLCFDYTSQSFTESLQNAAKSVPLARPVQPAEIHGDAGEKTGLAAKDAKNAKGTSNL